MLAHRRSFGDSQNVAEKDEKMLLKDEIIKRDVKRPDNMRSGLQVAGGAASRWTGALHCI